MRGRTLVPGLARTFVLLLALAALLLAVACEQDTVVPPPPLAVAIYEVGTISEPRERTFHGQVVAADLTRISFRVAGKINQMQVQPGQRVSAGQVLAQIDDSIQRQVLADARAEQQLSQRQLERAANLHRQGALTAAQLDQLQASARLAGARLSLAEAALSYTLVEAPFAGTVADVHKELYEAVAAGETVVTVYRHDRTDVLVSIPDVLPARSHRARDVTTLQVRATFSGSPGEYSMSYLKGSTARHPKTQAFQFWVTMPAPANPFPPGLPVTITADLQAAGFRTEAGLVVPLTALEAATEPGVFRVWRYDDGRVNPLRVEVGRISQRGALVNSGLQAGDQVVTSGLSRLSPGQQVVVQTPEQGR